MRPEPAFLRAIGVTPAEIGEEGRRLPVGDLVALLAGCAAERLGEMALSQPHRAPAKMTGTWRQQRPRGEPRNWAAGISGLYVQSTRVRVVPGAKRAAAT